MSQSNWSTNDGRYLPRVFLPSVPMLNNQQQFNYQEVKSGQFFLSGANSLSEKQQTVDFNIPNFATHHRVNNCFEDEHSYVPRHQFDHIQFSASILTQAVKQIFPTGSNVKQKRKFCAFCKKNGEPSSFFLSHSLHDDQGRVECPVLYKYKCSFCKATGILAHTDSHCPYFPQKAVNSRNFTKMLFQSATKSSGEHRNIVAGFKQIKNS